MQKILSYLREAVDDYNMIKEGDKIAIGLSGGKDSITLMLALNALKRFYPKKFEILAISLYTGTADADYTELEKLCIDNNIPYIFKKTDIGEIVFNIRKEKNPCSLCSKLRRGALNDLALQNGCNKLALGHHFDDAIETFFLSLFYESRVNTFSPVTYLDRTGIYVIRPMIYIPEYEVKRFIKANNITIVKNPCPANGYTKRQYIKDLLSELQKDNKRIKDNVFGAIKRSHITGWDINEEDNNE